MGYSTQTGLFRLPMPAERGNCECLRRQEEWLTVVAAQFPQAAQNEGTELEHRVEWDMFFRIAHFLR